MEDRPLRIGIIGTGHVGQAHMKEYRALRGVDLVACADLDESVARAAARAHDVPHVYTRVGDLLARDDLDAVDVCLHNNLHMPATVAALEAGKHVYCEKPMAGSYRDALTMLEAARRCDRKLHIQLFSLFSDETRAARELIAAGELGDLYHARSTGFRRRGRPYVDGYGTPSFVQKRHAGGGALYDMGAYHIAQVLHLLGNPEIVRISGVTHQRIEMDSKRRHASGYDVEELGVGLVRLGGGMTMEVFEAWAANLDAVEGSTILGSRGGVRLRPFGFFRSYGHLDVDGTAALDRARFRWDNVCGDGPFFASSQAHWVAALKGRVELVPSAEIALATMLVSEGIYLSGKLEREVTSIEVAESSISSAVRLDS